MKQIHIDNFRNFNTNLQDFLDKNKNIEIVKIITHKPYHITIIYNEIEPEETIKPPTEEEIIAEANRVAIIRYGKGDTRNREEKRKCYVQGFKDSFNFLNKR